MIRILAIEHVSKLRETQTVKIDACKRPRSDLIDSVVEICNAVKWDGPRGTVGRCEWNGHLCKCTCETIRRY